MPFKKVSYLGFLLLTCVSAFVITICLFAPRFFLWNALHIPQALYFPETNRASDTLLQLANPWTEISTLSNQVINWRLFFPLLGHYLHLPEMIFLSLPHLGCLMALALISHIIYRETQNFSLSLVLTFLAATSSWFFVSTGWLAYFDSWLLLGLLITTFLKSTSLLAVTCLLAPWIDERFILTLPLCLLIRNILLYQSDLRTFWKHLWISAASTAPYLIARLTILFLGDSAQIDRYLQINTLPISSVSFSYLFKGIWMGLRSIWILVAIFAWFALSQKKYIWAIITLTCLIATLLLNLVIAADISRSMSVLLPAALTGFILLYRQKPNLSKKLVIALLAFNLLVPATHIVTTFESPILNIFTEIQHYKLFPILF